VDVDNPQHALGFSLPDVIASVILTGKVPKIVDAFPIEPHAILPGVKPIRLRGEIEGNPRTQDLLKIASEQRKRFKPRTDISKSEKARLDKGLKVLANSTSYGIYGEMNRAESNAANSIINRRDSAKVASGSAGLGLGTTFNANAARAIFR
jgi:hypothetical protein